jgi:hypothetical protein
MRKLYKRQVGQAAGQGFSLRKHKKLVGDQGGGWNTRIFQLNGVVDTPRRARSSIGKSVDDDVASLGKLLEKIRSCAGHFSSGNELNTVVALLQKLADIDEKFIGIGFVIVQEANAFVS